VDGSSSGERRRQEGGISNDDTTLTRCWLPLMRPGVELLYRLPMRSVSPFVYLAAMPRSPLLQLDHLCSSPIPALVW
jgi:hypothetical protein